MKIYDRIVDGTCFWISTIKFSAHSFRVILSISPIFVKVSRIELEPYGYGGTAMKKKFDLTDIKTGKCIGRFFVGELYTDNSIYIHGSDGGATPVSVSDTKEEAVEYYNGRIQDQLDKLTSFYETKQKYLTKKFVKI